MQNIYIKNPYEKVELNRVVKEWEWVCDKYDKEKQIQPVTEAEVVDDYILKNILPDYFNRQQRKFLQDIIMSEDDINYDDKYKINILYSHITVRHQWKKILVDGMG